MERGLLSIEHSSHQHKEYFQRSKNLNMTPPVVAGTSLTITLPSKSVQPPGKKHQVHEMMGLTPLAALSCGGVVLPGIPTFQSMAGKRRWQLEHMVS